MPRLSASRPVSGQGSKPVAARLPVARAKPKKQPAPQDRLTARKLFFRRVRRSLKPGLWIIGGVFVLGLGSEAFRAIPSIGPVVSPVGSIRHGIGSLAAIAGFRIGHVEIIGADTTPLPVIQAALGVGPGDPILGFSLANAALRIEQLGPIQSAIVERALPDTLIVTVTERAPFAVWQTSSAASTHSGTDAATKFVLIDKAGNIIANQDAVAAKRRNPELLLLVGEDAPQNASTLMTELSACPILRARLVAAERIDGLRWNLVLKNNTVIKLPADNEQQALAQLDALQTSMALLDRPVEVIDLRLAGRMVIRPYPTAQNPPAISGTSTQADHT
jgi:cell division protein FtsQ